MVVVRDPATERLEHFCERLRDLRHQAGDPTLQMLSRRMDGHPGTTTLGDLFNAKIRKAPRWELIAELVRACVACSKETGHPVHDNYRDLDSWRGEHARLVTELEGLRQARLLGSSLRRAATHRVPDLQRVRDADPRDLGVHAAITSTESGEGSDLPTYVPRDVDAELQSALAQGATKGCFVLLVGGSSVGKTRCAYEVVKEALPDWGLLHPCDAGEVRALASDPVRRTVVWLDEIQKYLTGVDGLTAATVRVLKREGQVVIVGTLWADRYLSYMTAPSGSQQDDNQHVRELLSLAHVIDVKARLSLGERHRAEHIAKTDTRIRVGLESADYSLTQVLAAAPQLVRRWENAGNPYGRAVISAAIDAFRLGAEAPLRTELLRDAVPGYLTPRERAQAPADWFDVALSYANETLHGAAAALAPIGSKMNHVAGYVIADFLLHYGARVRSLSTPPASAWAAFAQHITDPSDLKRLAWSAESRALLGTADLLYRAAAAHGSHSALGELTRMLAWQGRIREATVVLTDAIAAGNPHAISSLAELLEWYTQTPLQEIEILWRTAVAQSVTEARIGLVRCLEKQGREAEAEQVWWEAITAGEPGARISLAEHLTMEERCDQRAVEVLKEAVAEGEDRARCWLAELLKLQGKGDEAIGMLREAAKAGETGAYCWLASELEDQGKPEEAREALRKAVDSGETLATQMLARLLRDLGRVDEIEDVLRKGATLGDRHASYRLADFLEKAGRVEEAEEIWRIRVTVGDVNGRPGLAQFLVHQGRTEEALRVLREAVAAGDHNARTHLRNLLSSQGVAERAEAERMWKFGLEPEDAPTSKQ